MTLWFDFWFYMNLKSLKVHWIGFRRALWRHGRSLPSCIWNKPISLHQTSLNKWCFLAVQADNFRILNAPTKSIHTLNEMQESTYQSCWISWQRNEVRTPQCGARVEAPFIPHSLLKVARDINPEVPGAHNLIQPIWPNIQVNRSATLIFLS